MSFREVGIRDADFGVAASDPARGTRPGLVIARRNEMPERRKAPANGVYVLEGRWFMVRAGDLLPEGAEFRERSAPDPEARAKGPAPEKMARGKAPEDRAKE